MTDPAIECRLDSGSAVDLSQRCLQPEWMDQPGLDVNLHRSALYGLQRVNAISFIHRMFWPAIRRLAARHQGQPLRILDVACGGGDVAVRLFQTGKRAGLNLFVAGCDISPTAVAFAKQQAQSSRVPCDFFEFDVLRSDWPSDYDVIVNSLFLHHLTTDNAVLVIGRMAMSTRHLLLINDLVRCREGYLLARFAAPLLSRSPIVHSDGPISVEAAFTVDEMKEMAGKANLQNAKVSRCWPARMLLEWNKP